MQRFQDTFWIGFADEVEKLAVSGKAIAGALTAGAAAAALTAGGSKGKGKAEKVVSKAGSRQRNSLAAQTGEEY